jgi:uncharacterized protein (DUF305 family)
MSLRVLPALLATLVLGLAACGGDDSTGDTGNAAGNGVDRAFVEEMIPHHEGAVEMAEVARERGESEFVKALADTIIRTQSAEIETMRDFKADLADVEAEDLGMSHSMMNMGDTAELQRADPFDEAFLRMMIPHHRSAIEMARIELERGKDTEIKALAQQIIDDQQREIEEMQQQLEQGA